MMKVIMKKLIKITLGVLGITAVGFFVRQEKRRLKNLRRNIDELNRRQPPKAHK